MEKNLSVADKIVLSSEITALGISRSLVAGARFIMPDTPKDLALEAALSIVGFPLLKRAPRLLRGALAHVDEVAGTKFASKYLSRITSVENKIVKLTDRIGFEATNITSHDILIGNRVYSAHSVAQMVERKITPSMVEYAIQEGVQSIDKISGRIAFDILPTVSEKGIHVVVDQLSDRVITAYFKFK